MKNIQAYAVLMAKADLVPFTIQRRKSKPDDVVIEIQYCGICHSDIHQARAEWGGEIFPMVPGHEIVGVVSEVGQAVSSYKVGDRVGVGCFVDSCRTCYSCQNHLEQYCEKGMSLTYNGYEQDHTTLTYGGYSTQIVVNKNYVVKIPDNIPLDAAAPLLCAGITTYSPLKHWKVKNNDKIAIIGLGGLGHMAIKFAVAMGAEVTVISTSLSKKQDALRFGAQHFLIGSDEEVFTNYENYFDFMLNTAAGNINLNQYLKLLKLDGSMVLVGIPEKPFTLNPTPLIMKRRRLAGSLIGGIKETQEMLDFCGQHNIVSDIEVIPVEKINEAYKRTIKGDVRYRFVIDIESLRKHG